MLFLSLLAQSALANERFFAWSYGADTVPQGGIELEPIATLETHKEDGAVMANWTHEIEVEYGITHAVEGGLYFVTSQTNDAALTFSGYKARVRYRFWPVATKAIDLAGYLEYVGSPTFEEHAVEAKIILAHEGTKVRAALNLTGELVFSPDGIEPVLEPTFGVAWRLDPHLALGVEGKVEAVLVDPVEGPFFWAGPTVHVAGTDGGLWWTLSAMVGLTGPSRDHAEVEARSMIGISL